MRNRKETNREKRGGGEGLGGAEGGENKQAISYEKKTNFQQAKELVQIGQNLYNNPKKTHFLHYTSFPS